MIDSKKYKTMDVIGYLKSVLEDARPYARMKLMIVGVQGIGKTSLLEQLRQEGFGSYKKKPVEVSKNWLFATRVVVECSKMQCPLLHLTYWNVV